MKGLAVFIKFLRAGRECGFVLPIVLLMALVSTAQASTVACTNGYGDAAAIQAAVNGGGQVTIKGTCSIASSINLTVPVTISGPATLNGSSPPMFAVWSNNVTITGLTFHGTTAATVFGSAGSINQNFTFTNNAVQNTNGSDGLDLIPIMQYASINNNSFSSIAPNGFASFIFNGSACYPTNTCDLPGTGINGLSGWDNSTIQYNTFDLISSDAIHIAWNSISQDQYYFLTSNVSVSYNTFSRVHRISIEAQGTTNYVGCTSGTNVPANCSDLNHVYCDGFKVAGNYAHDFFQTYVNTFGYSLVTLNNQQYINNSAVADNPNVNNNSSLAYAQETSGHLTLSQGNVYAADYFTAQNPHGWSGVFTLLGGSGGANPLATIQNNFVCTDQVAAYSVVQEAVGFSYPSSVQYNYNANVCPNAGKLTSSSIKPAFISTSTSGKSITMSFGVVSSLSIRNVQFFIDNSSTAYSAQELSDLSPTFSNDARWLYHTVIDSSTLTAGAHVIKCLATDVSGASQSVSQSFTVAGATGTPVAQLTPTSLSFAAQTVGTQTPAQVLTLNNSGTAPLAISTISITGANAADFQQTSTCGTALTAGTSCKISVVFTPSINGTESGSVSVADNASGSPQSSSLAGIGTAVVPPTPAPPGPALPTNLPGGIVLWLANNAGVIANGNAVNTWEDQSGNGNNATQVINANQPLLVNGDNGQQALRFNGTSTFMSISSLPINGLTGMAVFAVTSAPADLAAGYGSFPLLNWPETTAWGQTFFGTYQSFAEFRFGTTQTGNENRVPMTFNRTNSFGLNEWFHSGTTDSMFLNGQAVATLPGKSSVIAGVGNAALIGINANTYYSGDVSEIIVYNRALSTSEQQAVEQYLMTKYHL